MHATALLTHLHFDHILGIPFFSPLHDPGARLTVYGPAQPKGSLKDALARGGAAAGVPDPHGAVPRRADHRRRRRRGLLHRLGQGDGAARSRTAGVTLGFRIEAEGRSVAYMSDHQAPLDRRAIPEAVLELCQGVDLLIHDGQYTDDEFSAKADWGHSTAAYAVHVAAESGRKRLLLSHHDPSHTDRELDRILNQARRLPEAKHVDDVSSAHESQSIDLGKA